MSGRIGMTTTKMNKKEERNEKGTQFPTNPKFESLDQTTIVNRRKSAKKLEKFATRS